MRRAIVSVTALGAQAGELIAVEQTAILTGMPPRDCVMPS